MPLYEYECSFCGKKCDIRQSIKDETKKLPCECGGEMEKKISSPNIHFKGKGFYQTDYKGEKSEKGD